MEQYFCVRWYTNAVQPKMINATPGTPSASPNPGVVATPTPAVAPPAPPIAPPITTASGISNSSTPGKKPGRKMNLKVILGLIVFLVVAVGGVAGFYLSQQSQEIRQQASGGNGVPTDLEAGGVCSDLDGCTCPGGPGRVNVANGESCASPGDGVQGSAGVGEKCYDGDGCTCGGGGTAGALATCPATNRDFCDDNGCNVGSEFPNCWVNHYRCNALTAPNGCQDIQVATAVQSASFSQSCGVEQIDVQCQGSGQPYVDFVSNVHGVACGETPGTGGGNTCVSPNQCVTQGSATPSVACGLSGMEPGGAGSCGDGQICCRPSTYVPQCPWDSSGVGTSCIGDGTFAPQGRCEGGSNNGGNCTLDSHCGGGGRCVGYVPCCPGLTGLPDGVCKCPSGSPPPAPSPSPPTQSACGGPCQTTADCRPAATGVQVVCRNNTCQNLTCPEGQTVPGANCSCGVSNRTCGQRCGHGFGLCDSTNGTGSMCTFTSGVACTGESQQTYCVGFTNWQVSNPAFTTNFCGNTGSGNSYLIRKADNKTTGFTQEEIQSTCAICGDGILHIGEECDEGPNNGADTATCDTNCKRKDIVTYSCNSTCTTDAQCQTSNPGYVCDPSARRCRLASNPTSNTCQPLAAAACLNISLLVNGQQVAFGADDPEQHDVIQLVCAEAPRATRYIFRVTEPDGQLVQLGANNGNVSDPYYISKIGSHKVQCQICTGPDDNSCLPFE